MAKKEHDAVRAAKGKFKSDSTCIYETGRKGTIYKNCGKSRIKFISFFQIGCE